MKTILFLKSLTALFFLIFFSVNSYAQNNGTLTNTSKAYSIIRSNTGMSGSSHSIVTTTGNYIINQSIGQYSVIGTHYNEGYTLRQGYQQPSILIKIILLDSDTQLNAVLFPNPFEQSIFIAFNEDISDKIKVDLLNVSGQLIFSQNFQPSQELKLNLPDIARGSYIINVSSDKKQIIAKLIKR